MKFEMVSGDEKLFDGAPDWAEIVYSATSEAGQLKAFSGRGKYQYINGYSGDMDPGEVIISTFETGWYDNPKNIAERRPITEPESSAEWNGEGLPPVGVECEMQASTGPWIPVHIIANYDGFSFGWNYDSRVTLFSDDDKSFRPIRSPQEIAREETVKSMCAHWNLRTDLMCESIYDAIAAGKIPGIKLEASK